MTPLLHGRQTCVLEHARRVRKSLPASKGSNNKPATAATIAGAVPAATAGANAAVIAPIAAVSTTMPAASAAEPFTA